MRIALILLLALGLSACSKFRTYDGPAVTRIVVFKEERIMHLLHGDKVLKSVPIDLGWAPSGHKAQQGDGRTPEGRYTIDRRNPDSKYHLSIGISYPNEADVARARMSGKSPGGDIFIHGTPRDKRRAGDWTWGCIAVSNREMEEIYAMVRDGTVIDIYASAARTAEPRPVFERPIAIAPVAVGPVAAGVEGLAPQPAILAAPPPLPLAAE